MMCSGRRQRLRTSTFYLSPAYLASVLPRHRGRLLPRSAHRQAAEDHGGVLAAQQPQGPSTSATCATARWATAWCGCTTQLGTRGGGGQLLRRRGSARGQVPVVAAQIHGRAPGVRAGQRAGGGEGRVAGRLLHRRQWSSWTSSCSPPSHSRQSSPARVLSVSPHPNAAAPKNWRVVQLSVSEAGGCSRQCRWCAAASATLWATRWRTCRWERR